MLNRAYSSPLLPHLRPDHLLPVVPPPGPDPPSPSDPPPVPALTVPVPVLPPRPDRTRHHRIIHIDFVCARVGQTVSPEEHPQEEVDAAFLRADQRVERGGSPCDL